MPSPPCGWRSWRACNNTERRSRWPTTSIGTKDLNKAMNLYCDLFWTFSKIGVCTFGGGYAMLPILQREVVEKKGWATEEELTDYFAIGQCTPGVIAVNTATFVGHKYRASRRRRRHPGPGVPFPHHHHPHRRVSQQLRRLPPGPARPGRHQRLCGGADRRQRAEAGKEHPEKRPRRVHFSGGSGPGGGGQPAASGTPPPPSARRWASSPPPPSWWCWPE